MDMKVLIVGLAAIMAVVLLSGCIEKKDTSPTGYTSADSYLEISSRMHSALEDSGIITESVRIEPKSDNAVFISYHTAANDITKGSIEIAKIIGVYGAIIEKYSTVGNLYITIVETNGSRFMVACYRKDVEDLKYMSDSAKVRVVAQVMSTISAY